jgi:hypothetical protein
MIGTTIRRAARGVACVVSRILVYTGSPLEVQAGAPDAERLAGSPAS